MLNPWISVEDRLPKEGAHILCYEPSCDRSVYAMEWENMLNGYVTHWMPLPNPPESSPHKPESD